jgi:hypothetical protein
LLKIDDGGGTVFVITEFADPANVTAAIPATLV